MSHAIERTNKKGVPLIGRCIKCGKSGLKSEDALKPCPKDNSMSDEEALLKLI